jgi:LmbE family N-acetylglucosaminyl deacetylase
MIKKIVLIIIGVCLLSAVGTFLYFYRFQNMPEFSISLLSELPKPISNQKILIFSPHNDDEVLSSGGYIYDAIASGSYVTVVFLTNGDGHYYSSIKEFHKVYPTANDYIQSGYTRQEESKNALKKLGVSENNIIFLGYPDNSLKELTNGNWDKAYESKYTKQTKSPYSNSYTKDVSYTGSNVNSDIIKILNQINPEVIIYPNAKDTNKDHTATAEFIKKALNSYNQNNNKKYIAYSYLIHYWHFPYPKGEHMSNYLMPPMRLLYQNWQKYSLSDQTQINKYEALNEYKSQLKVPMLKSLMYGFIKRNELFVKN